jgi:hypothetical protein
MALEDGLSTKSGSSPTSTGRTPASAISTALFGARFTASTRFSCAEPWPALLTSWARYLRWYCCTTRNGA